MVLQCMGIEDVWKWLVIWVKNKANSNVGSLESIYKLNITITFDQVS